ncbi:hypothetical protein BLOT_006514 [Blomia tropicalis]|nr:hypothetical protein BLOT_006514 [Blomia tropicalis]
MKWDNPGQNRTGHQCCLMPSKGESTFINTANDDDDRTIALFWQLPSPLPFLTNEIPFHSFVPFVRLKIEI